MDKLDKKLHINFWYIIAAVLGMLLIQDFLHREHKAHAGPLQPFSDTP